MNQYPQQQQQQQQQQYPQQPQYPQQAYPQQAAMPADTSSGSTGKTIGGIIMMVFGMLFFLGTAFFGYFCIANYGAADRIEASRPDAAWVADMVRKKAGNQGMIAGVLGMFALVLGGGGIGLTVAGRKKKQGALGGQQQHGQWTMAQAGTYPVAQPGQHGPIG